MCYREFTSIIKVKQAFGLTTVEGPRLLPQITPIAPSATLTDFLANSLPVAVATGSEKARLGNDYYSGTAGSQEDFAAEY